MPRSVGRVPLPVGRVVDGRKVVGHLGSVDPGKQLSGACVVSGGELGHRGSVEPGKQRGGAGVVGTVGQRGSVEPGKHRSGAGVVTGAAVEGWRQRGSLEPR